MLTNRSHFEPYASWRASVASSAPAPSVVNTKLQVERRTGAPSSIKSSHAGSPNLTVPPIVEVVFGM